jgi:hypothetical protein
MVHTTTLSHSVLSFLGKEVTIDGSLGVATAEDALWEAVGVLLGKGKLGVNGLETS